MGSSPDTQQETHYIFGFLDLESVTPGQRTSKVM